jgi:hypothetical protein
MTALFNFEYSDRKMAKLFGMIREAKETVETPALPPTIVIDADDVANLDDLPPTIVIDADDVANLDEITDMLTEIENEIYEIPDITKLPTVYDMMNKNNDDDYDESEDEDETIDDNNVEKRMFQIINLINKSEKRQGIVLYPGCTEPTLVNAKQFEGKRKKLFEFDAKIGDHVFRGIVYESKGFNDRLAQMLAPDRVKKIHDFKNCIVVFVIKPKAVVKIPAAIERKLTKQDRAKIYDEKDARHKAECKAKLNTTYDDGVLYRRMMGIEPFPVREPEKEVTFEKEDLMKELRMNCIKVPIVWQDPLNYERFPKNHRDA